MQENSFALKITPLGGVGQVGSNMAHITTPKDNILIDAGIMFPAEDFFNINYLIPDFYHLHKVSDLIITHGHEDHIGAVAHVCSHLPNINIHAPSFAAALIERRLKEQNIRKKINIYDESDTFHFDSITIHPVEVNHSIPQTYGFLIKHSHFPVSAFYISDFRYDASTVFTPPINFDKLGKLTKGSEKIVLLADSTNILRKQDSPHECDLQVEFNKIFEKKDHRIFVTLFSSNIYRLQTLMSAAKATGRKVIPYGRSMNSNLEIAKEHKLLSDLDVLSSVDLIRPNEENLVILLTGCQGDFKGSLNRVSSGEDPFFKPRTTDTFIFSSSVIPGNEKKVSQIQNRLAEFGCNIITSYEEKIHASGHPNIDELSLLYKKLSPTDAAPVHGDSYFLLKHCEFIKERFPQTNPHLLCNFSTLEIDNRLNVSTQKYEELKRPILIHGNNLPIERECIRQRRKIAQNGVVFLTAFLTQKKAKVSLSYSLEGLPQVATDKNPEFEKMVQNWFGVNKITDQSSKNLKIAIRKFYNSFLGYKPVVIVHLVLDETH